MQESCAIRRRPYARLDVRRGRGKRWPVNARLIVLLCHKGDISCTRQVYSLCIAAALSDSHHKQEDTTRRRHALRPCPWSGAGTASSALCTAAVCMNAPLLTAVSRRKRFWLFPAGELASAVWLRGTCHSTFSPRQRRTAEVRAESRLTAPPKPWSDRPQPVASTSRILRPSLSTRTNHARLRTRPDSITTSLRSRSSHRCTARVNEWASQFEPAMMLLVLVRSASCCSKPSAATISGWNSVSPMTCSQPS